MLIGHATHAEALLPIAYDPREHATHLAAVKKPALQTHIAIDVAPATADAELLDGHAIARQASACVFAPAADAFPTKGTPAGHIWHTEAPTPAEYVPPTQLAHAAAVDAPSPDAYVPLLQFEPHAMNERCPVA